MNTAMLRRLAPLRSLAGLAGNTLLDALYPLECCGCGRSGKVVCDKCSTGLAVLEPPFCQVCSVPGDFARCQRCAEAIRSFEGVRAPFRYSGVIRQAVFALKYGGIKAAAPQLGDMLGKYLEESPLPGDALAAVPMHPRRRRERGYNQADLLARRVASRRGLPYRENLLVRSRHVEPQASLADPTQRAVNVADSVSMGPDEDVAGARIILIDDVATTGSTLEACAAVLKRAGAASVWGLTLAVAGGQSLTE